MESMQAKWEEMFGEKEEKAVEELKVKKPRKKAGEKKEVVEEAKVKKPRKKVNGEIVVEKKVATNKTKSSKLKTKKRKPTT